MATHPDRGIPESLPEWLGGAEGGPAVAALLAADLGPAWRGRDALGATRAAYLDVLADRVRSSGRAVPDLDALGARHHRETGVLLALMAACPADGTRMPRPGGRDPVMHALAASFGRPAPFARALGPVFHWAMERRVGRAVPEACMAGLATEVAAMAGRMAEASTAARPAPGLWG